MKNEHRNILLLCLTLLLAAPTAAAAQADAAAGTLELGSDAEVEAMMLRLRDGSIRWGAVLEHDPDGLRFAVLSNGGQVRVPWSLLDPEQEYQLRLGYGYVDVSSEELMIDADRLTLKNGEEVTGVIMSREGESFMMKVSGNLQVVPKINVASVQSGLRIPALEVYSRDEIYRQHLAGLDPQDPEAVYELAKTCERILDFQHAVEHYQALSALDPSFRTKAIQAALALATVKAAQQEQIDYLRDVDQLRRKGLFDKAQSMCSAFTELYPQSPLVDDAAKKLLQIQEARDRAATELVRREWKRWTSRLARDAAKEMPYSEAVTYCEEQMGQEVAANVLETLQAKISPEIQPEHVRAFWENRKKVRYELASFGHGSWLLGKDGAQKGMNAGGEEEKAKRPTSETDATRQALQDKIKKFLANQERARAARAHADKEEDRDRFWNGYSVNSKAQWIRAYYCEFGGDYEVRPRPRITTCRDCGGKGVREIIYAGGSSAQTDQGRGRGRGRRGEQNAHPGSDIVDCPLCRGVQVVRKIYYR